MVFGLDWIGLEPIRFDLISEGVGWGDIRLKNWEHG